MPRSRLLLLVLALLLPACGGEERAEVTVFAASSLTGAFEELAADFEEEHPGASVRFSFGASSSLAAQLAQGAPADVLATADEETMASAEAAGTVADSVPFASNRLSIVLPRGNPRRVQRLADLEGLGYAVCDPAVPCGRAALRAFEAAGVRPEARSQEVNVKAVLARVAGGELDAGIVYRTDVLAAGEAVTGVDVEDAVATVYRIAVTAEADDRRLARSWVDYVTSPAGRAVLADRRFLPPPGG